MELSSDLSNFNQGIFIDRTVNLQDTLRLRNLQDGTYKWRVTAINSRGSSKPSSTNTITILTKTPSAPILKTPIANSTTTSAFMFTWTKDVETTDSLFVYKADSTTLVSTYPSVIKYPSKVAEEPAYLDPGKYYWKVRSVDNAKNVGPNSVKLKFFVP